MNDLERLATALKFEAQDLEDNRKGRMSAAQRARTQPPPVASVAQVVILAHFVLLAGLFGAIAIFANRPVMWGVFVLVMGMAALPFILSRNEFVARPVLQSDLAKGKVARACGTALFHIENGKTALLIEGERFEVSTKVSVAFRQGRAYCVYYLPQSHTILSAEPTD